MDHSLYEKILSAMAITSMLVGPIYVYVKKKGISVRSYSSLNKSEEITLFIIGVVTIAFLFLLLSLAAGAE